MREALLRIGAGVAVVFGLLTVVSGGVALFGEAAARQALGAYVWFVLWFNFIAGFTYVLAGVGLWLKRRWAVLLATALTAATALVFAAFAGHVLLGGAYEMRTVLAMASRTLFWAGLAWAGYRWIWRSN